MRFVSFLLIGVLLIPTALTHAQLPTTEPLTLSVSPQNPRAYDTVTVTVGSNLVNLAAATITFSAGGEVVSEGARSARVKLGAAGTSTTVSVTVLVNGQTYTRSVTLRPADVALIVEPQTSAHPLYEGGLLVAPESRVRLIAIPEIRSSSGNLIPPAELSFVWRLGERILNDYSGLGKNVLVATAPVRYRDAQVSVTVSTKDGSQTATASTYISPAAPLVRLYRNDPLAGTLFEQAIINTVTLTGEEETFVAVPYFFSQNPSVVWTLNGAVSGTDDTITVRTTNNQSGSAILSATASQGLETAEGRFTLQFGGGSRNIFGF